MICKLILLGGIPRHSFLHAVGLKRVLSLLQARLQP